jgi:23S rRNA (cytidine2498-2'-O)-methyltransferase
VKGDAFRWLPPAPVDWLLSDVVAFPPRVIELLDGWLSRGLCRRFVATVKFRGDEDYPLLEDLKRLLAAHTRWFRVQRMATNKNEATAWGEVRVT